MISFQAYFPFVSIEINNLKPQPFLKQLKNRAALAMGSTGIKQKS